MDELLALCDNAKAFPQNLPQTRLSTYNQSLYTQLSTHAERLFSDGNAASMDFLELHSKGKDFWPTCVRSESRLRSHLRLSSATKGADPRCRFMFLNGMGGSSRAKLQTTREMLMLSFTYAHVMPEFVEFLFSFGYQSSAQDPYFSSFRQRFGLNQKLVIPELAWSGNEIQMCYNLKSAERSASSPSDWSIRDCAVHHILDLKNPRANWIIVKGNEMMKNRIEQATGDHDDMSTYETVAKAFSASLLIHLLFCEWAAEQWRWYIINLEEQFQNTSQRALTAPVALRTSPTIEQDEFQMTARTETQKTNGSLVARVSRTQTMLTEKLKIAAPKPKPTVQHTYTDPESGLSQPLPPNITVKDSPDSDLQQPEPDFEDEENQMFSFARLQQMQHIEEKIHETLLILRLNISIMQQIKQYYDTVTKSHHFPRDVFQLCQDDINHFELRINGIVNNLQMQILRLETLLRLLGDRKNLVSQIIQSVQGARLRYDQLGSILEYRNTQLNKESTKNMMSMTEDMNEIARKTKIETVSMKVITVVTLFFLPGTFISTLMSTAIFQSSGDGNPKHPGPDPYAYLSPLQLYLVASLPLTFVTIIIWAFLHWLEKHKETLKAKARRIESLLMV